MPTFLHLILKSLGSLPTWPPHLRVRGWRSFVLAGHKLVFQDLPKDTGPNSNSGEVAKLPRIIRNYISK